MKVIIPFDQCRVWRSPLLINAFYDFKVASIASRLGINVTLAGLGRNSIWDFLAPHDMSFVLAQSSGSDAVFNPSKPFVEFNFPTPSIKTVPHYLSQKISESVDCPRGICAWLRRFHLLPRNKRTTGNRRGANSTRPASRHCEAPVKRARQAAPDGRVLGRSFDGLAKIRSFRGSP